MIYYLPVRAVSIPAVQNISASQLPTVPFLNVSERNVTILQYTRSRRELAAAGKMAKLFANVNDKNFLTEHQIRSQGTPGLHGTQFAGP